MLALTFEKFHDCVVAVQKNPEKYTGVGALTASKYLSDDVGFPVSIASIGQICDKAGVDFRKFKPAKRETSLPETVEMLLQRVSFLEKKLGVQ